MMITFAADGSVDGAFSWGDGDMEATRMERILDRIINNEILIPTCRICGCTEADACEDKLLGRGCSWVEPDLCSVCARELEPILPPEDLIL